MLCLVVPASFLYLALGRPIVELTLRRGDMTLQKAHFIADTVRVFVLGLPAFSVYLLLMNALKAMRNTRATFTINAWENAINIVLAGMLYGHFGVQGLALSFALAYFWAAFHAGRVVGRSTNGLGGYAIATSLRNIMTTSVVMALASWLADRFVRHLVGPHGFLLQLPYRLGLLAEVGSGILVGVTVFLAVGRMARIRELRIMLGGVRRRIDRRFHPTITRPTAKTHPEETATAMLTDRAPTGTPSHPDRRASGKTATPRRSSPRRKDP